MPLKTGFSIIARKDFEAWKNLDIVKQSGVIEKALKDIKEEFYTSEVDKGLLEKLAFYKAILDYAEMEILEGRYSVADLETGTSDFAQTYRWAEVRYYKSLDMVRSKMPKVEKDEIGISDFIKNLE